MQGVYARNSQLLSSLGHKIRTVSRSKRIEGWNRQVRLIQARLILAVNSLPGRHLVSRIIRWLPWTGQVKSAWENNFALDKKKATGWH